MGAWKPCICSAIPRTEGAHCGTEPPAHTEYEIPAQISWGVAAVAKIPVWPPVPSVRKMVAPGLCGIICLQVHFGKPMTRWHSCHALVPPEPRGPAEAAGLIQGTAAPLCTQIRLSLDLGALPWPLYPLSLAQVSGLDWRQQIPSA